MEQIKTAITQLEQAVLKLETAVYANKKDHTQTLGKLVELKQAIRRTYDRLDKALDKYKKGEA